MLHLLCQASLISDSGIVAGSAASPLLQPASFVSGLAEVPLQMPSTSRIFQAQAAALHAGMRRRPSSQAGLLATAPAALVASTATQVAAGAHDWHSGRQGRPSGPVETSDSSGTSRQTEGGESTWSPGSIEMRATSKC